MTTMNSSYWENALTAPQKRALIQATTTSLSPKRTAFGRYISRQMGRRLIYMGLMEYSQDEFIITDKGKEVVEMLSNKQFQPPSGLTYTMTFEQMKTSLEDVFDLKVTTHLDKQFIDCTIFKDVPITMMPNLKLELIEQFNRHLAFALRYIKDNLSGDH